MKYKVYVDWLTQWGKDYLSHLKQIFQGKLTAGQGVTIDENNVISASSTGDEYMLKENPVGSGSLSMNRLADSTVGTNSVALGTNATASGTNSLAGGRQAVASGANSLAYGNRATASGGGSAVAIGNGATASGSSSVAMGRESTASGKNSVALSGATATGDESLAFGEDTEAYYDNSIALGEGLITTNRHQVVIGKYNATNYDLASFIVGDGTNSDSRYNVMWIEGNCMYIQATKGNNPLSVVNIKYLQDNYYTKSEIDTMIGNIN